MGSVRLPQAQLTQIQAPKGRRDQTQAILSVMGNNPFAQGINEVAPEITDALEKRAQLRRQTEQAALYAQAGGLDKDTGTGITDPALIDKLIEQQKNKKDAASKSAKERAALEFELEKLRTGYSETNPATGQTRTYPGVQGLSIGSDEAGNPIIVRDKDYKPKEIPKNLGGGSAPKGSTQQTSYSDSSDGMPLFFDRDRQRFVRSDGKDVLGVPVPSKGQAEAIQTAGRSAVMLPKIDMLFDALKEKGPVGARAATLPGISNVFYPEINQLKNEVAQIGFTFGGKSYTGQEKEIIVGALIPTATDNDASREAKRQALKGYIEGNIDLMQAANLIGPAGNAIKELIKKSGTNESTADRKARLLAELAGSK